jgi:hypothetical protein
LNIVQFKWIKEDPVLPSFFFFFMFIQAYEGGIWTNDFRFMRRNPQLIKLLFEDLFLYLDSLNYTAIWTPQSYEILISNSLPLIWVLLLFQKIYIYLRVLLGHYLWWKNEEGIWQRNWALPVTTKKYRLKPVGSAMIWAHIICSFETEPRSVAKLQNQSLIPNQNHKFDKYF